MAQALFTKNLTFSPVNQLILTVEKFIACTHVPPILYIIEVCLQALIYQTFSAQAFHKFIGLRLKTKLMALYYKTCRNVLNDSTFKLDTLFLSTVLKYIVKKVYCQKVASNL